METLTRYWVKYSNTERRIDIRKPPWRVETRVEKWVEEEKEVARNLFANVQKPGMEIYLILCYSGCNQNVHLISRISKI